MPLNSDPFTRPSFDRSAAITGAVRVESVAPRGIDWLWPRRIPLGAVTLLVGDPGLGKSLLALDIATRVSNAAPWPDECTHHTLCDDSPLSVSSQSAIRNPNSAID